MSQPLSQTGQQGLFDTESALVGKREDILGFLRILAENRFCGDLFLRDLDGA